MAVSIYKSITREDIANIYPGYQNEAWLAPRSAFTLLQEPAVAPGGVLGDKVTIKTAHTFPAGEGFIKVYCSPDTIEAPSSLIGPLGAKRAKWEPKIFIPGDTASTLEQVLALVNDDMILLVKDANCPGSQILQFGCNCTPANVSAGSFKSSNTGDESGQKGWEITFTSYCKYFYNATVTEKPAA